MKMNLFGNQQESARCISTPRKGVHGAMDGINAMPAVIPTLTEGALLVGGAVLATGAAIGVGTLISNKGDVSKTYEDVKDAFTPSKVARDMKEGLKEALEETTIHTVATHPKKMSPEEKIAEGVTELAKGAAPVAVLTKVKGKKEKVAAAA